MESTWLTIAQWMLRAGVGGGLILALALVAMRRVRQPARRQRLGEAGLLAALALAVLAMWPAWIPIHYGAAQTPRIDVDIAVLTGALPQKDGPQEHGPNELSRAVQQLPEQAPAHPAGGGAQPALVLAAALYAGGAAIFLTRWLLGLIGLRRLIRGSAPAEAALVAEFAAYVPTRRLPRLLVSRRVRTPISCGIWRPTVILPAALAAAGERERRAWVFAHELTHIERRDAWSCVLFALGQVLFFPVPWFWRLQRHVRLCQEFVADAAAVSAPAVNTADVSAAVKQLPAEEYASFLLTLTAAPVVPRVANGVSGSQSDLYRRVTMLLENPLPVERRCPAWWTAGAAGALVGLAVFGAGVGLAQAPPNQREVLQQLDRIQELVNNLRRQVAETPSEPGAPAATLSRARKTETKSKDAKAQQAEARDAVQRLYDARVVLNRNFADLQKAAADSAKAAQDRVALDAWIRGRVEETDKKPETERAELIRRLFLDLRGTLPTADEMKKYLAAPRDRLILMFQEGTDAELVARTRSAWAGALHAPREDQLKKAYELIKAYRDKLQKQPPASKEEVQKQIDELIEQLNQALQSSARVTVRLADPNSSAQVLGDLLVRQAPRGRLGVRLEHPSDILRDQLNLPKDRGLVVVEVFDGSVARKAGVQVNDILLKIGDQEVDSDAEKLAQAVAAIKPDSKFGIVVLRRGKPVTIREVELPATASWSLLRATQRPQITVTLNRAGANAFVARRVEGDTQVTVEAALQGGKAQVRKITIVQAGKPRDFTRIDDVPAEHRAKVEQLVQVIGSLSSSSLPPDGPRDVLLLGDAPIQLEGAKLLREPAQPNIIRGPIRLDGGVAAPGSSDVDVVIPRRDGK